MKKTIINSIVMLSAVSVLACCSLMDSDEATANTNTVVTLEADGIGEPYLNECQTRISLFNSPIRANGKEYNCEVFLYHIDNETTDTVNGLTAIELSCNGIILDRKNIYTNCGIVKPVYSKVGNNEYWSVLPLKNDVVAFISPLDETYSDAVFVTVNSDEKLQWITRYFSEKEISEKELYGERFTIPELRFFTVTDNYDISDNKVIFKHDNGKFSVMFDFENYQLLCNDEGTEKTVYYQ